MKIAYILLAMLICIPIAIAEKDNMTAGPFKISFDMGIPKASYKIQISSPVEPELHGSGNQTDYSVFIANTTGTFPMATILLTQYKESQVIPTPEELEQKLNQDIKETGAANIHSEIREIDGIKGALVSATLLGKMSYLARWYPSNELTVGITSTYPWDEGTMALVNTIHIEKATQ